MSRGRGLAWIIQKLKELEISVNCSMFPSFLDLLKPESHNYLEKVANINIEIERLEKNHIEVLKRNMKARQILTDREDTKVYVFILIIVESICQLISILKTLRVLLLMY